MIKSVTVINPRGETLVMTLRQPELTGFNIVGITGIGPVKAIINSTAISSGDGAKYNSSRLPERNIVFDIEFLFVPDIETVRQASYRYFPIKKEVFLIFETDNRLVYTVGRVEANSPNIFKQKENTQVSIICMDPYFYGLNDQTTIFSTVEPGFEFPFGNESFTTPMLEFGDITSRSERSVLYDGESDTGFVMHIYANGDVGDINIQNQDTGQSLTIQSSKIQTITGSALTSGDEIIVSTITGSKYVKLLRNGEEINILASLGRNPDWLTLQTGDNVFAYSAETSGNMQFRIENKIVYDGI